MFTHPQNALNKFKIPIPIPPLLSRLLTSQPSDLPPSPTQKQEPPVAEEEEEQGHVTRDSDQVRQLRILLQKNQLESAQNVLQSQTLFSSPSHVYKTLFNVSANAPHLILSFLHRPQQTPSSN
ncbi:hypothetical protein AAC387_Pa03g1686 [Persea americana]